MNRSLRMSKANAELLTEVGLLVRIQDAVNNKVVKTRSLPWQLGHGEWVVKVEGKSGGWCCSMLSVITRAARIHFVDGGQDFTVWTIDLATMQVIECGPFQGDIWVGRELGMSEPFLKPGSRVVLKPLEKGAEPYVLKYPIERVERFTGKVVAL